MTNFSSLTDSKSLLQQIASLLIYQSVFDNELGHAFLKLLKILSCSNHQLTAINALQAYGDWFKSLALRNQSWQDYLVTQILIDDNPFSQQVQTTPLQNLPQSLVAAVRHDLQILQTVYQYDTKQISEGVKAYSQAQSSPIYWHLEPSLNSCLNDQKNWTEALSDLANHYCQNGTGIFAQYHALRWQNNKLIGIANPDPIEPSTIVGYESQKEALLQNTQFLLAGYRALHVLLYGSRGSGKSSLVKSLLSKYHQQGLRLIEVSKSELQNLPLIIEKLRNLPQKFIIFVDDLSFEEDDDAFKALKVVLEGSLTAPATNVVVYATSNRRHLVREFFGDRPRPSDNDEVHVWDTVQEKLSFSDRFGLTLTFEPANQTTYLTIVNHLARQAKINLPQEELEFCAKQWAIRHNARSGRTARQFIDYLQAKLSTSISN